MRRIFAAALVWMALGAVLAGAAAQSGAPLTVESVLRQLDEQAKTFRSLSADVERTKVTVVVDDRSVETGSVLVRGDKMLLKMNPPDERTVLKTGDNLDVYTPGLQRVEEYNLGKNRALVEQFLLLGFGTSGRELSRGYRISLLGEPALGGKKTVELELTPKSRSVIKQISKIQIWLDELTWLPVQQQLYETGSGDYSIIRYSNVSRNPSVPDSKFKPHWPKGTVKVKPQG